MRSLILTFAFILTASSLFAAEKSKTLMHLDATRAAVEAQAARIGENREARADLEQARSLVTKAQEVADKGKAFIVFGDLKSDAEQEITNYLDMGDLLVANAASRFEKARAAIELEALDKQFAAVKAKIKIFEDRKNELEKLRAEVTKCGAASRELELAKGEKALLTTQIEQFGAERSKFDKLKQEQQELNRKLEEGKTENSRLVGQLEKLQSEIKGLKSALEESRKPAPHKEQPDQAAPAKELPLLKSPPTATDPAASK